LLNVLVRGRVGGGRPRAGRVTLLGGSSAAVRGFSLLVIMLLHIGLEEGLRHGLVLEGEANPI
jgi:hypothetical protein